MIDPGHWLWRLDAAGWAAAAEIEWTAANDHVARRRTALAHCRRAAGMALNGVLVAWGHTSAPDAPNVAAIWGRSYVEHLQRIAAGEHGPLAIDAVGLASEILATPMTAAPLVTLGAHAHADVTAVLGHTQRLIDACAAATARLQPAARPRDL